MGGASALYNRGAAVEPLRLNDDFMGRHLKKVSSFIVNGLPMPLVPLTVSPSKEVEVNFVR